jgi:hypothetical protein
LNICWWHATIQYLVGFKTVLAMLIGCLSDQINNSFRKPSIAVEVDRYRLDGQNTLPDLLCA